MQTCAVWEQRKDGGLVERSYMHVKGSVDCKRKGGVTAVCSSLQGIEVMWTGGNCSCEISGRMGQRNERLVSMK